MGSYDLCRFAGCSKPLDHSGPCDMVTPKGEGLCLVPGCIRPPGHADVCELISGPTGQPQREQCGKGVKGDWCALPPGHDGECNATRRLPVPERPVTYRMNAVDQCANQVCSNRAGAGRMATLTVFASQATGNQYVSLVLCSPCADRLSRMIR